jgi:hypothetical protein
MRYHGVRAVPDDGTKSMKRILTKLLRTCWLAAVIFSTAVLLLAALLCVESFTGGLWMMHHDQHVYQPSIETERWVVDITSARGRGHVEVWPMPQRWADQAGHNGFRTIVRFDLYWLLGWYGHVYEGNSGRWFWTLWISYGTTAIIAAVLPAIWTVLWLRRRRLQRLRAKGLCITCGYDLRASPERCPECGAPVEQTNAPAASSTS